eukprot:TRINITY_DN4460_c0_g1_i3.p1 TRINITY_DN4460_c0_g1~~TRINITY_DN4460_c0_g1_i3.p1  ORF type:complete len:263 (+),score=11.45 TRINITY_DN4460_c0_g1_i3:61-849(+)
MKLFAQWLFQWKKPLMSLLNIDGSVTHYKLAAQCIGHRGDVRSVYAIPDSLDFATSSRDTTAILWAPFEQEQMKRTFLGHGKFVGAVMYLPSSPFFMDLPCIVTASNDHSVIVWNPTTQEPLLTLLGHTDSVVCLSHVNGLIVSGSWDNTARVWQGPECIMILKGHSHSVWAVLGLPTGEILTGSADSTIKRWKDGQCTQTLSKHTNCVRGLAHVPEIGFVSCSNDCVNFLWSYDGRNMPYKRKAQSFAKNIIKKTKGIETS